MPPVGFKRSRALWDHARDDEHGSRHKSLIRAVLYELQPLRYSEFAAYKASTVQNSRTAVSSLYTLCAQSLPSVAKQTVHFSRNMSSSQWKFVAAAIAYYIFVRWIHAVLDAGPVVLIVSALVAIFTVGLSDEDSDGLSAYSVFNKGFQKLMGSVDADALLQQHFGGGMLQLGMGMQRQQQEGVREVNELPARLQRPQQHQLPVAAAPEAREDPYEIEGNDDRPQPQPNNRARKTGKKARRGNAIERRRELRAQREAAVAMGFGGGDEGAAMFRLMEDQVAGGDEGDEL
jgi:Uncharacterized conserved domain (SAYSvFN)